MPQDLSVCWPPVIQAWFGLVPLLRGLFLSLASVVAPNSPNVQLALLHTVMLLSLVLQSSCHPWKSPALNLLDAVSQSLFLTLLGVGLAGLQETEDDDLVLEILGTIVCTGICLVFGIAICVFALAVILDKLERVAFGRKCANLGEAPDPVVLVFLLENIAKSIKNSLKEKESVLEMMDQLGTHDARG
eukprot:Skav208753  [mRNA]  locus=scaffold1871:123944:129168:+ [translate_table: standard]